MDNGCGFTGAGATSIVGDAEPEFFFPQDLFFVDAFNQVGGGGGSRYSLCKEIPLTPNAAQEARIAAKKRRENLDWQNDLVSLDEQTLESLCSNGPCDSPSPLSTSQDQSSDPFLEPMQGPTSLPPPPAPIFLPTPPGRPDPELHAATPDPTISPVVISASQPGRWSNKDMGILTEAFGKIDVLLANVAKEIKCPVSVVIEKWNHQHRASASTSTWNLYQIYFTENMEEERERVGDPEAGCKLHNSLPLHQSLILS